MRKLHQFLIFLKIQPGEERLIGLLILLAFALELAVVLILSMAFGVFLTEYGSQALPYSYIMTAIFASLAAVLYIKLSERVSFSTAIMLNLASLGTLIILVWLGLKSALFHYIAFILPFLFEIVLNFGNLVVWQLAGCLFNLQQAKRLYPLIISGSWLPDIFGGLLVLPLVNWMGAINLLVPATLVIGLAMLTLRRITPFLPSRESPVPSSPRKTSAVTSSREGLQNRYTCLIFFFVMIWGMSSFFLDNIFADRVAARFPDVNQLTVFRGQILSLTGIVAFITSTFLTSRIVKRFGLRAGLLSEALTVTFILGLLVIIGSLGESLVVVFNLVVIAKLVNVALGFSVTQSSYNMLYQPMHETVRGQIQAKAEGVFQPIASGLAGLTLLALTSGMKFNYLGLAYVNLGIAILVIAIIVLLSSYYVKALTQAITKRRLGESPVALLDPTAIELLSDRLSDPHPGVVLYALNKLETLDQQIVFTEIPKLIEHPSAEVRREVFMRIEKLKLHTMLHQVQEQLLIETSFSVKESALRALGAIADDKSPLINMLNNTDVHCLRGALIGLLMYGNESKALEKLTELLSSTSSNDRNLAIEVLGKANRREYYPYLIAACDLPETHRSAGLALVSIGANALSEIETAFGESEAPRQRLLTLAKVLGFIGGTYSQNILLSRISESDHEVRLQILNALSQSGYRARDLSAIQQAVKAEVGCAAWVTAAQADLGDKDETALLMAALDHFYAQILNHVLLQLSFAFDHDSIQRIHEVLTAGSAKQISYALEIIDAQIPPDWKPWVMPLLENLSTEERNQRYAVLFPQEKQKNTDRLCAIIENEHFPFWVRACAVHTFSQLNPNVMKGDFVMLSTVEKVLILKTVSMFSQTPDNVLADVADILEEVNVSENESIFKQGEPGDSLYVIVDGKVRVHDGERLLNYLGESDVFGEMALLDPEPRLASVTAVEETRLFRLEQTPFYELMSERPEVATGIIRVLTRHLRNRVRDIAQLNARIKELESGRLTNGTPIS